MPPSKDTLKGYLARYPQGQRDRAGSSAPNARAGELLLQVSSETKAGIKWIKVHEEGKQRQERFEEATWVTPLKKQPAEAKHDRRPSTEQVGSLANRPTALPHLFG